MTVQTGLTKADKALLTFAEDAWNAGYQAGFSQDDPVPRRKAFLKSLTQRLLDAGSRR